MRWILMSVRTGWQAGKIQCACRTRAASESKERGARRLAAIRGRNEMQTTKIAVDKQPARARLELAAQWRRPGSRCLSRTETVYGLGPLPWTQQAVHRFLAGRAGRPISSADRTLATLPGAGAYPVLELRARRRLPPAFWPGP